jgi:hypothetical protein
MWQERNGSMTTPAAVDSPVGHIEDMSPNGHDMFAATDTGRPILRQAADGVYYLENSNADGAWDYMESGTTYTMGVPHNICAGIAKSSNVGGNFVGAVTSATIYHAINNVASGARNQGISRITAGTSTGATTATNSHLTDSKPYILDSLHDDGASAMDISINGRTKVVGTSFWTSSDTSSVKPNFNRSTAAAAVSHSATIHFYGAMFLNADPGADRANVQGYFGGLANVPLGWTTYKPGSAPGVIPTSGSITLNEPATVAEGDLMVACIAARGNASFTLPTGWTLVAQHTSGDTTVGDGIASGLMAYIIRGASAPDLVFTRTGGDVAYGRIEAYSSPAASSPFDTHSATTLAATSTTAGTPGLTTAEDGELLVAMLAQGRLTSATNMAAATDPTVVSGADAVSGPMMGTWLERVDVNSSSGADLALAVFDSVKRTAGATGNFTATSAATNRSVMIVAAFKRLPFDLPPGGGGESLFGGTIVGAPT